MTITEFAHKYQISEQEIMDIIDTPELSASLRSHISYDDGVVNLDEDGEWVLSRYLAAMGHRMDGVRSKSGKFVFTTKMMIAIIILVFLIYMTSFVLMSVGVISKLTMTCIVVPVTLIIIALYYFFGRKKK